LSFNVNTTELAILLSILLRLSFIFFMLPIFTAVGMPSIVKALIVLSISIMLFPVIKQDVRPIPFDSSSLVSIIVSELIYAMVFSLSMHLVMSAFELAGELIGFEMGFGFSQTADPNTGARFTVLSAWTQMLATMILLSINGHHIVLRILAESFKTVPIGSFALDSGLFRKMVLLSATLFILALKLAAPVLSVLVLTQIGLGLMSKFAPQINVLATSFPLTIALGMLFFGLTITLWGQTGVASFSRLFDVLRNLSTPAPL